MSAFIVSHDHIDALVTAARALFHSASGDWRIGDAGVDVSADQFGALLWSENHASVNHRYGAIRLRCCPAYRFRAVKLPANGFRDLGVVGQALMLLDCYEYQSCEHPTWKDSNARWFCDRLRAKLETQLPGRNDWNARDRSVYLRASTAARALEALARRQS